MSAIIRSNINLQTELGRPVKSGQNYTVYRSLGSDPWSPDSVIVIVEYNLFVWLQGTVVSVLSI